MKQDYSTVGKSIRKKDAWALVSGKPVYTGDYRLENPLHGAFLYSDRPHAEIVDIDTSEAFKVTGVVDVLSWKNVKPVLHTTAGQGYPEPSPYDTVLFDRRMRFVGDRLACVVAETRAAAERAARLIKVKYNDLPAVFDPERAMDRSAPILHEGDEHAAIPVPYRPEENLAAEVSFSFGDTAAAEAEADFIEDNTYTMHYASHCALEPHCSSAYLDAYGRVVIITATQVPFHARRIVAAVCGIPTGMVRVIKPRVGGGFGGKQEVLLEPVAALIALRTGRAVELRMSREEVFSGSRTRHQMRSRIRTAFMKDGTIISLTVDDLLNAGAYGSHALTVLSNAGSKVLPLFNKIPNVSFTGRSVYTNLPVGGAYRGYGATQGYFALNQQIDIICRKTGQDILEYIKKHHIKAGETSEVFKALGEGKEGVEQVIHSCGLSECIDRGAEALGWYEKRGKKIRDGSRVRGVGVAVAMQGSGIPQIDMASVSMKMNEDGSFNLLTGATDLGTGSDTILAQIAAEALTVPYEKIHVLSSDTDLTPFDVGAYASSTTYVTGNAVKLCAQKVLGQILESAAGIMEVDVKELTARDGKVIHLPGGESVDFGEVCSHRLYTADLGQIQASASYTGDESPPPFIAQFADVEVDIDTGRIHLLKFVSAIDCGTAVNPTLAEGQVEGSVVNGISYALTEEYRFDSKGRMTNPSFGQYKIYTAPDIPKVETILVDSFEETGPFGAKSAGEIAINGPAPAIGNAVFDAVGVRLYDTPFTPEKVWNALKKGGVE